MRWLPALLLVLAGSAALVTAGGQDGVDPRVRRLFPTATSFSPRTGDPPHYEAFTEGPGGKTLIGYAFWTTEIVPLERGYDGPIPILVGLAPDGTITSIVVGDHREPYGDFSIDRPAFANQFKGKDVRDRFRVGQDIDAVSRATISITSATRAIRDSARRVARQYLTPPSDR